MSVTYDYHLHSHFSGDCDVPPDQMIEKAIFIGMKGLCFTEHHDPDYPDYGIDFLLDFRPYFEKMEELKSRYGNRIWIGAGMEFGIMPHLPSLLEELQNTYSFDFIIASMHFVDGKDPYYPDFFEGRSERESYERYFSYQYETLKKFSPASYDTLGHMDFVVRYGPNKNKFYSYEAYAEYLDPILKHLIENGKCLEVNTGGFKYGLGEPNPCVGILKRYRQLGGELITIGSDAHEPRYLGYDFFRAAALLTDLGFRYYTVFQQRMPRQIPLY